MNKKIIIIGASGHGKAVVSSNVNIGDGTVVMAGAIINVGSVIGSHCIINTASVVEHDNTIEDYSHISVGVKLAGTVHVGKLTRIGIDAVVSNNVSICENVAIGTGEVVIKNIKNRGLM